MRPSICKFVVVMAATAAPAYSDDDWTYNFIVNGSRPVHMESDTGINTFADIAGSFSFLVDWENGTGRPLEFRDHLTNLAFGTYSPSTGWVLTPANLPEYERGIFGIFGPPQFQDGHFVPTDGSHWEIAYASSFSDAWRIKFNRTMAWLSIEVGIDDAPIHVSNATALFAQATIAGDYTNDSRVDARDYVALRHDRNSPVDFALWRAYFGSAIDATGAAVPESSAALLLMSAWFCLPPLRKLRR